MPPTESAYLNSGATPRAKQGLARQREPEEKHTELAKTKQAARFPTHKKAVALKSSVRACVRACVRAPKAPRKNRSDTCWNTESKRGVLKLPGTPYSYQRIMARALGDFSGLPSRNNQTQMKTGHLDEYSASTNESIDT
ncbi:uncharacterized protein LOC110200906 [Phascolarctos cinereus]